MDALYLYDGAGWVAVGSGGAVAFTDLTDAPSSYTGEAGKVVAVNGTETGLEFVTVGGGTPLSVTTVTTELAHLHYANTLGASGSFQAITALPSGYDRVKIRLHLRGTVAAASDVVNITINGGYDWRELSLSGHRWCQQCFKCLGDRYAWRLSNSSSVVNSGCIL
ncbi:MAG: hypothetical protein IPK52_27660 [Chloroflexi bacterium]|nr:hypothetical protein [Chloroflexota bacterium]